MSPLYLYAVLGAAPATDPGAGLAGEPLALVECGGFVAAAGEMATAPEVSPDTLRAHDAVVRRLAASADALIPARFGSIAAGAAELRDRLARGGDALRDALARVRGREQMILRVYVADRGTSGEDADRVARDVAAATTSRDDASGAPGTRYLLERARTHHAASGVAELAPIRTVLDRFVEAERVDRHHAPPLVASVYHLVARGTATAYSAAVEDAARGLSGIRVTVSGPWAPYAFAPDLA